MRHALRWCLAGIVTSVTLGACTAARRESARPTPLASAPVSAPLDAGMLPDAGPPPPPVPEAGFHVLEDASSPMVSVRWVFRTGFAQDPPGREGLASLAAALVVEASTRLDANALARELYPLATSITQHVDRETTTFALRVHRDVAPRALPLFVETLTTPRLDPADLERLRAEALAYVRTTLREADDEELGKAVLDACLWRNHPYGRPENGTVAGLRAITLEDLRAHVAGNFTQARLLAGVGGAVDPAVLETVRAGIRALPRGEALPEPPTPPVPIPPGLHVFIVRKPAPSTPITLGFHHGLHRAHADTTAAQVAVSILGEHRQQGGRLFDLMRERRGLNYGDYAYLERFVETGGGPLPMLNIPAHHQAFTAWARPVAREERVFALRLLVREVRRFQSGDITEAELGRARAFLAGYSRVGEQSISRRVAWMLDDAWHGTPGSRERLRATLPNLQTEAVNNAVRTHLAEKGMVVTLLAEDADELREQLLAGTPTPRPASARDATDPALRADDDVVAAYALELAPERVHVLDGATLFESGPACPWPAVTPDAGAPP